MIVCVEFLNLQACILGMCIQWYVLQSGMQIQTHMLCNKICLCQPRSGCAARPYIQS